MGKGLAAPPQEPHLTLGLRKFGLDFLPFGPPLMKTLGTPLSVRLPFCPFQTLWCGTEARRNLVEICSLVRVTDLYLSLDRKVKFKAMRASWIFKLTLHFYRVTLCVSAVFAVAWCLSVRLAVCLKRWSILSRRLKISSNFFIGPVAPSF